VRKETYNIVYIQDRDVKEAQITGRPESIISDFLHRCPGGEPDHILSMKVATTDTRLNDDEFPEDD
jgi:hypothetical protein